MSIVSSMSRLPDGAYESIFGHSASTIAPGGERIVVSTAPVKATRHGSAKRWEKSMAMGCVKPEEQAKRLAMFAAKGITAQYERETGRLMYRGGLEVQKRLAKMHGMDVG